MLVKLGTAAQLVRYFCCLCISELKQVTYMNAAEMDSGSC